VQPTQTLPSEYVHTGTLDITKDARMMVGLNVLGLILLVLGGWFFFVAITALRPQDAYGQFSVLFSANLVETLLFVGAVLALTVLHVMIHEAIHGIFFWKYTRTRPLFAFRWTHAYAAAPAWYLPRNQYLITALAPLVVITLLGLLLAWVVPASWLLPLWFILTSNAGGSVGDMWVAGWLLLQPVSCLANDRGDAVSLYNRA
jgi:hypothetical protein